MNIGFSGLVRLLESEDSATERKLFAAARRVKEKCGKVAVLKRALIECSNICAKDCIYCGIRKSNDRVCRYRLPADEVIALVDEARRRGFGAVAFQAGEVESEENSAYYQRILLGCRDMEVTLSLGEQEEEVYRRWREAGAMRYLLRIETSNRRLYAALHPGKESFDRRVSCLRSLKRLGYITGSGVMIAIPGQTTEDLAADIEFFGREKMDMVGMGPYIAHPDTPLAEDAARRPEDDSRVLSLSLRMIALVRLYLHSVNIVSSTALEALCGVGGRNAGIEAGANVIMPVMTPDGYRQAYDLYPGKTTSSVFT